MVRVVGKEGALGAGGCGNCSSGMDGSKTMMRWYPGRGGSVFFLVGISIFSGAFEQES